MKKAFIVTSSIEVNNDYPLSYSHARSFFSAEERLRQTVMTVSSIDTVSPEDTQIYIVDTSENYHIYENFFCWQPNVRYISVRKEFPDVHKLITTHRNKSYCETLLMSTFIRAYQAELKQFDYFFKFSGRYFLDRSFNDSLLNEHNTNCLFFKHPLAFEWSDSWGYGIVDLRAQQGDNTLRQYCTVLYGWGRGYHDRMLDLLTAVAPMLNSSRMSSLDIETLSYYLTRPWSNDIIETDWTVTGWLGASGEFMRY
jgi:hypothetical protein